MEGIHLRSFGLYHTSKYVLGTYKLILIQLMMFYGCPISKIEISYLVDLRAGGVLWANLQPYGARLALNEQSPPSINRDLG